MRIFCLHRDAVTKGAGSSARQMQTGSGSWSPSPRRHDWPLKAWGWKSRPLSSSYPCRVVIRQFWGVTDYHSRFRCVVCTHFITPFSLLSMSLTFLSLPVRASHARRHMPRSFLVFLARSECWRLRVWNVASSSSMVSMRPWPPVTVRIASFVS